MIRADYVNVQQGNEIVVVYPASAPMKHLRDIAGQLAEMPGLKVAVAKARVSTKRGAFPTISIVVGSGADVQQLARRIHELAQPTRAITVMRLTVTLLYCSCDYVSSRPKVDGFLLGFGPDDDEVFILRFYARVKDLPVARLISNSAVGPDMFAGLLKALEELMHSLGAHVAEIHVQNEPDLHPCTHS